MDEITQRFEKIYNSTYDYLYKYLILKSDTRETAEDILQSVYLAFYKKMQEGASLNGYELYFPQLQYCGDNAAMVAAQGYYEYLAGNLASLSLNAYATLPIDDVIGESSL